MEEKVEELLTSAQDSVSQMKDQARIYRRLSYKLDEIWKECKIRLSCGTIAAIVGGVLTIVATLAGRSVPRFLMFIGMAIQAAGAVANADTNRVQAKMFSDEIKKAEEKLKEVSKTALTSNERREQAKFVITSCLAFGKMELPAPIKKLFQKLALSSSEIPEEVLDLVFEGAAVGEHGAEIAIDASRSACEGATAVGVHGAQIASDASGSAVKMGAQFSEATLFCTAFFLLLDVYHLVFTAIDILMDKKSDLAENYRQQASELERACRRLNVSD